MGRMARMLLGVGLAVLPIAGLAQGAQSVSGVVRRGAGDDAPPVPSVWVVLHRVGNDTAAAVDSVRSDARGRYAFTRAIRNDSAVFFTSATYGGVAYFTVPFRGVDGPGDAEPLVVYDTTSAGPPVRTRGRHVIVSLLDPDERRAIVEMFELENDSRSTRVASRSSPSWSTRLPPGANGVHIEQGDLRAEAIEVRDDRVDVLAPITPGLRQVVFSYDVHASSFPLTVPVPDSTTLLEVLLEDAGARVEGAGLAPQEPVSMQGRTFQRYAARDVPAGAAFIVIAPVSGPRGGNLTVAIMAGLVGVALLLVIARAALGAGGTRTRGGNAALLSAEQDAQRLARAIADLDARFERTAAPTPDARAAYDTERARLQQELTAVLASRDEAL